MALLSLQNFNTLVQNFASTVQGSCRFLTDFSTGSILLAIAEASASVGLTMQYFILQVLQMTRLATSVGTDADTWVNDFNFVRLPAVASTGVVTLSRFSSNNQALILPGAQVKTGDATQIFNVIADTTKAAWNAGLGGYVIAIGAFSCDVTVQSVNLGIQGNVQPAAISLVASAIPFVDSVTNALAFANGVDAESDANLQARFSGYIQSRSKGTLPAIQSAIAAVQQGISSQISENTNLLGGYQPGNFVAVIDDGTGATPSGTLTTVGLAIQAVRPIGTTWSVVAPTITTATISFTITTNPTANKTGLLIPVRSAVIAYVNSLPDGATLFYTRIAGIAYSVDPSIVSVEAVLLNAGTVDLVPVAFGGIKATTGSVTVG